MGEEKESIYCIKFAPFQNKLANSVQSQTFAIIVCTMCQNGLKFKYQSGAQGGFEEALGAPRQYCKSFIFTRILFKSTMTECLTILVTSRLAVLKYLQGKLLSDGRHETKPYLIITHALFCVSLPVLNVKTLLKTDEHIHTHIHTAHKVPGIVSLSLSLSLAWFAMIHLHGDFYLFVGHFHSSCLQRWSAARRTENLLIWPAVI